jgi:hypothetical protein
MDAKRNKNGEATLSSKNVYVNSNQKKTWENLIFSGYEEHELTEFPGFLEAPQILNNLSIKMNFKVGRCWLMDI